MNWTGPIMAASRAVLENDGPVPQGGDPNTDGVRVSGLSKRFGETRALVDASLSAAPGEIHAIVGENGSGKSTLAKVLSGIIVPDSGEISIFGSRPSTPAKAIAAGVATIFQEILVAEELTVLENLFAGTDGLWKRRVSETDKRRRGAEIMSRLVGSPVDLDQRVRPLPLAVKQWIVIARALLSKPRLLIFDESSAALDLDATQRLHEEMRRLKAEGCTILLVTHRIAELIRIADGATILRDGVTVGRLGKSRITEERILALMSADGERAASGASAARETGDVALHAREIALRPDAEMFDFEVRAGEIVGLAGLDGAGQAEFAQALAGIAPPARGTVLANGAPIVSQKGATDRGLAYVSGDRKREGIFPRLSILENFGMALMRNQAKRGTIDVGARAKAFAAGAAQLSVKMGRPTDRITTLSGGNQQKVLIARAFAGAPKVIVLNDPARGVDIGTKQDLWQHLRDFAARGGAVVYLSSEIEEFPGFADRVDVFVGATLASRLSGADVNEARILAAMFGREEAVSFKAGEVAE
jgi:ribose transport system ATP-binding protein